MDQPETPKTIRRKEARSGQVSYSEPAVLHESNRLRVVMVPFYVKRSDGTHLAVKLVSYRKADPPTSWAEVPEKTLSLQESAARKLLAALKDHLAIATEEEDGSYVLIRVSEGTAEIGEHDPAVVANALAKVLGSEAISEHLAGVELTDELVSAFRGAIRLKEMRQAVASLRAELDAGHNQEHIYQRWCQQHTWAFGNAYVMRDEVRNISEGDQLDLLLPTVISGYRDIVELKRPDMPVLLRDEDHRNYYFSAEVSRAMGQCHRYLDVLHEVASKGLRDHPEIVAYHPRATIVIGRSSDWTHDQLRALHGLNRRLSGVTVMTYDQLLAQGERLVQMLSEHMSDSESEEFDDFNVLAEEDDFPF